MTGITRAGENRRTETPNAVMTTLASPATADSASLSLWRVEMAGGAQGPAHSFDSEQIWTVVEGSVKIRVGESATELGAGDTIVIPASVERQIEAPKGAELLVCGMADAVVTATGEPEPRGTPDWIA